MQNFFTQQEFDSVKKQRLSSILTIIIVLTVYLMLFVTTIINYLKLPFEDARGVSYKAILYTISGIVIIYLYVYIGIKYRRVNKYYKMMCGLFNGSFIEDVAKFVSYSVAKESKDGVDVKQMVFSVYNERRNAWFDRTIYIPYEKDFPVFNVGDMVKLRSQSNFLISYKVVSDGLDK